MTANPSLEPATTGRDELTVTVTRDDFTITRTTDDLVVVVSPDVVVSPVAPIAPVVPAAPVTEKHAPRLVTALVGLGLIAVAGAMVVSATDSDSPGPTVPTRSVAVSGPVELPTTVRVLGAQRVGDAVLLRIDPVGDGGARSLVVSPDAIVILNAPVGTLNAGSSAPLQSFLDVAATPSVRQLQWHLRYDSDGAVAAISLAS